MATRNSAHPLHEIAAVLASLPAAEDVERFLASLLTPGESAEIGMRWELVKRLAAGTSQRAIARDLGLSLCKITRGSRELKKKNSPFRQALGLLPRSEPPHVTH
jgi:TrpR family transcriptional regulator, trp operon repressor